MVESECQHLTWNAFFKAGLFHFWVFDSQDACRFCGRPEDDVAAFAMSTTNKKTAACPHADHTKSALALAWNFQRRTPRWSERFASLLDERLKQMLPEGCLREILHGQESEIRQRATLLLLERFLMGNQHLQKASESDDMEEVANQIQRSISASLRIASYRVRRSIQRDRGRFTEFDEAEHSKQSLHPAEIKYVRELPLEAQRQLLLFLLEEGVRSSAISTANSQIIHQMVDQELSQTEMAKELGISRQAVNQRIRCVAAGLNEALERAEFPMQST